MKTLFLSLITGTLIFLSNPFASSIEDTSAHSTLTGIGGGYGFLVKGEGDQRQVMLVIDSRWPNDLNFVGGAQNKGELSSDTFKRKITEKTGCIVDSSVFLGSWRRTNANSEGANDTCDFYAGRLSDNSPEPEAVKPFLNSVHWLSIEEIRQGDAIKTLFPAHLHFLMHFLNELTTMPRQITAPDFQHPDTDIVYHLS
ncbi:MAG: NUDIX hydrolase [Alphaproteobacteria bacterium]|nr:NUDIX hydrolase [Alphaproteobacteria bacterium]